jgi:hypothetical protein
MRSFNTQVERMGLNVTTVAPVHGARCRGRSSRTR